MSEYCTYKAGQKVWLLAGSHAFLPALYIVHNICFELIFILVFILIYRVKKLKMSKITLSGLILTHKKLEMAVFGLTLHPKA